MKFCKVVEPLIRRFENVPRPLLVMLPALSKVAKRLVEEAVVEKKLVVVALVPVALTKVKFCSVLDPVAKRLVVVANVVSKLESVVRPEFLLKMKLEFPANTPPSLN